MNACIALAFDTTGFKQP